MKLIRRFATLTATVFALGMLSGGAFAEEYPSKPIRLVAPYPPGSVTDLLARMIGQKLTESWKQPVIVDNRGGGGSVIGTDTVAKAPPDGYTILMVAPDLAINQSLHSKLPYDAQKSFAPVTLLVTSPTVLIVNPSLPVGNLRELIAYAKARPGRLSYASGGNGTVGHLGMEILKHLGGIDMLHVPYKGTAAVVSAVLAGEVQVAFAQMSTVRPHALSGKFRVLANASGVRAQAMPDVPTVAEAGLPGYKADVWFGLVAPAGTPGAIVSRLNREIGSILNMPDVRAQLLSQGIEPRPGTADEFAALIDTEIVKWGEIVRKTGSRLD